MKFTKEKESPEAIAAHQRAEAARQERSTNPARRWEYRVVWTRKGLTSGWFGGAQLERILNKLGSEGWEFAFLTPERLVFKREILKISPEELWELGQVQVVDEE